MLEEQFAIDLAQAWIAAWNSHDLEAIMAHYAEEIEFTSPFIVKLTGISDGTLASKGDLKDYFNKALLKYPDLHFDLLYIGLGVNSLVIHYRSIQNLLAMEFMSLNSLQQISRVVAHYSNIPN